ncbi:MAG: metallophosphoesterase [Acidobacteriia bacterium]|nr:metallophosphoesterase [Terriglobia bacterium]
MPRGLVVFLIVALAILFGFQYFIYFSTTRLLGINGRGGRRILMAALVFLLAGVVASVFLQRSVDTALGRGIAGAFQLSIAFGLNLAMAFLLAWASWGFARVWNPAPRSALFGWIAILLAALFSVYGVWNATHPRVERMTVRMNGLPPEWRGKTIAQISDLHLGFSGGRSFAERVIRMVNAERPAAVVITGDLFDGGGAGLDGLADALNALNPRMGIYFVTGNHETYLGVARAEEALRRTEVRVLHDDMATPGGLQIVGIAYPDRGESKDIGAAIRNVRGFDPAKASVLLYHSPVRIPEIKATGIRLQLSGHTHRGQLFPFQFITRRVYGKYDHGLNVEGNFTIYTSSGTGTWGPRMRTSSHAEIAIIRLEPI